MFLARESLFVSGGRNAERGMIALRVQDPAARHEEAQSGCQGKSAAAGF